MAIFSQYPRKNYIPTATIKLSDNSKTTEIVLDHLNAKYNDIFSQRMQYTDFMVDESTEGRLDLIAWQAYGSVDMWWVIGYFNGIINPIFEVTKGKKLKIPSLTDAQFALEVSTAALTAASRTVDIP